MAKYTNDELLEAFGEMTLVELSEFVKAFEEKFDVEAAAPVAAVFAVVAAVPAAVAAVFAVVAAVDTFSAAVAAVFATVCAPSHLIPPLIPFCVSSKSFTSSFPFFTTNIPAITGVNAFAAIVTPPIFSLRISIPFSATGKNFSNIGVITSVWNVLPNIFH